MREVLEKTSARKADFFGQSELEVKMGFGARFGERGEDDESVIAEKKRAALDLILDAWCEGIDKGIDSEILAHAAMFAAFSDLADIYGEDALAKLAEGLPARIHKGEFTLPHSLQ